jgi:hypothetical protein
VAQFIQGAVADAGHYSFAPCFRSRPAMEVWRPLLNDGGRPGRATEAWRRVGVHHDNGPEPGPRLGIHLSTLPKLSMGAARCRPLDTKDAEYPHVLRADGIMTP